MRKHYASRLRLPLDIAVVAGLFILGAYEARSDLRGLGIALLSLSSVFALMLVAVFTIIPKIAFRSQPKLRDEYSLRFSSQGIHFRTAHIDSDLQWGMYTRALVDGYSFILYYGSQQFTVYPNEFFRTPCSDRHSSDYCSKKCQTSWIRRSEASNRIGLKMGDSLNKLHRSDRHQKLSGLRQRLSDDPAEQPSYSFVRNANSPGE